jgi:hypothetical protein
VPVTSPARPTSAFFASLVATLIASQASADPSSTSTEQAYDLGDIESPRAMAFGGAQAALGTSTTALYSNPANLALARVYHFEGLGAWSPQAQRQSYGGGIADSATNQLAARPAGTDVANGLAGGMAGVWSTMDPDGINRQWTDVRVALAYPITETLFFGLTGRYLTVNQSTGRGPLINPATMTDLVSDGTPSSALTNIFTFNAGLTFRPVKPLALAVLGQNLTYPGRPIAPTTLTGAIGLNLEVFSAEFDTMVDFTTYGSPRARAMLGMEVFMFHRFAARIGYRIDAGQKTHSFSTGIGWVDKHFSVEASLRQDVIADHPNTMIVLGLRYFYDYGGQAADPAMTAD